MAAKWEARAEAFYAGGEGWGLDTAGYCKTPEEAEQPVLLLPQDGREAGYEGAGLIKVGGKCVLYADT